MITIVAGNAAYTELNAQPMVSYRNLLAEGTITDAALPAAAPREDAVTQDTSEYWAPTGADSFVVGFGSSVAADCAFFAAHNLSGKLVSIQYNAGAGLVEIAAYTPTSNDPFMIVFPQTSGTTWAFTVNAACQIGVAWIGPRLVIPGGVVPEYTPVWAAERLEKFPGVTRRGHFRGQRIERAGASLTAQFMPVTHTFALSDMADFRDHFNEGNAFVWASAPSVFARDVAYCWADQDKTLAMTIRAGGHLVNVSMEMEAYVER